VNRRKRDCLISARHLQDAHERILEWWERAYLRSTRPEVVERFPAEARMTLPLRTTGVPSLEEIMTGVDLKRMALSGSREIEPWAGKP
jgi:hypothetical protein